MANIGIFIGREHHAQKLMNIGRHLAMRGHTVFPITANNAINIDPPQMGIGDYIHIYKYLTANDIALSNQEMLPGGIKAPLFWKLYSLREQLLSFLAFRNYLDSNDVPDCILILHENNFWTKPLSYLCEKKGVPCFAFQEGLLRKQDQVDLKKQSSSCEYSTAVFVWGEDSRRQYLEAGVPDSKIIVSGAPHLALAGEKTRVEGTKKMVTYFLPLLQHYYGNPQKDISAIASYCANNGFRFVVRPHPFENEMDLPFLSDKSKDVIPLILATDIALVQHSTTALECLSLGTPIIEVGFGTKDFIEPLAKEQPAIPSIKSEQELGKISNTGNYVDGIREWIEDKMYVPNKRPSTLDIIADRIEESLS